LSLIYKFLFCIKKGTIIFPNFIVYGELGRFPLEIRVKLRMISYWCKLVNNETKLSSSLYRLMLCLKNQGQNNFKWINYVESILKSWLRIYYKSIGSIIESNNFNCKSTCMLSFLIVLSIKCKLYTPFFK
jgi:hypothetical protein